MGAAAVSVIEAVAARLSSSSPCSLPFDFPVIAATVGLTQLEVSDPIAFVGKSSSMRSNDGTFISLVHPGAMIPSP